MVWLIVNFTIVNIKAACQNLRYSTRRVAQAVEAYASTVEEEWCKLLVEFQISFLSDKVHLNLYGAIFELSSQYTIFIQQKS